MDSYYETNTQRAVRPDSAQPDPGYSYWADGQGWQSQPGTGPGGVIPPGSGAGAAPTAAYHGGPGVPPGPGPGPGGYGVPGGYGPGGPSVPVGPGWAAGPVPPGPGIPPSPGTPGGPGGPGRPGPGGPGPGGPRRPPGPRGRRKGDWWRRWTWKKAGALAGAVFLFFVLGMFGVYQYMSSSATIPAALASATYQNTTVYYADGKTVLGTFGQTNRQDLTYSQIPMMLQNAVVAAEDKNFWTEGGISPTGILRAAYHDLMNSGNLNGGSTITQEFVRNYYDGVGTQQTASRKIKEIFIAQKVASTYSKQWIMTNYLNLIPMGQGAYGVEAAAKTYFGVPASKLTIAQDAVLAALIQAPSAYSDPANRSVLENRWRTEVLAQMVNDKYITAAQAAEQKFPVMLTDQTGASARVGINSSGSDPWAPYLMTQIENELTGVDGVSQSELETGGLRVVTTISRPMEAAMYKAVNENLNAASISSTPGATVTSLPPWALVGAELQNPQNGQIVAEYPGKGQEVSAKECDGVCQDNTASQTREQVGSSFKPYVLAAAVNQGMNVQTSTLDTSPYVCVMPDGSSDYSQPITAGIYNLSGLASGCPSNDAYKVENDGGELIGKQVGQQSAGSYKGAAYYSDNVQDSLAQSSNTGFTDLAHKVGTADIVSTAQQFGVNTANFPAGSGLHKLQGDVGMALGIGSLTVQEQTSMLSTIADNGMYHQAHLVKYWQQGASGAEQMPKVDEHIVIQPNLAADVQYAMERTTIDGTAAQTVTFGQNNLGTVIGKTGTTTDSKSGFFIGATSQYSLVVGMFTVNPKSPDNLAELGGGGFGGYWPAKIWNTFAESEFSTTSQTFPTSPAFYGTAWNMLGTVPKAKPVCSRMVHGQKIAIAGKGCPSPAPTPTCTWQRDNNGKWVCSTGNGNQTTTATCQYHGDPTCTSPTPNPTTTCQWDKQDRLFDICTTTTASNSVNAQVTTTASPTPSASAGVILPGTLLLTGTSFLTGLSRRRKRKNRPRTAE